MTTTLVRSLYLMKKLSLLRKSTETNKKVISLVFLLSKITLREKKSRGKEIKNLS